MGDIRMFQSLILGFHEIPFHFPIQTMPHQFEHDITIAIDARTLSLFGKIVEYLLDIGHVEITAKAKILRLPVVAAQERMYETQTSFSCRTITQVAHVHLTGERKRLTCIRSVSQLFGRQSIIVLVYSTEDFRDGIATFRPFTKHILITGFSIQFNACQTSPFLTTVMLFLHHQVEFVEAKHPRTILPLIILQRFQQSDHGHTALVLQ